MNNSIAVTIAILTYNRAEILDNLLKSLSSLTYKPLEIIVVDNNSQDETEMVVKNRYPRYIYLRMNRNIGAAARNLGISNANGEIIICLDDDVFGIDDNQIKSITKMFVTDSSIGAINFKITDFFSGNLCNWAHHCASEDFHDKTFITYEITEGAVAFRKSALNVTGAYAEYFFLSHEGPDLAFRLIDNGYRVIYTSDIVVQHSHSNGGRKAWTNYYYDTRNALWFAVRNLPISYMIGYLGRSFFSTLIYAVRDGFLKYWLKAVRDAIACLPSVWSERKVVTSGTMKIIEEIDAMRPPLFYLIMKRLFSKTSRL
jgi:GT2 family glycosyltransferase